MSSIENNKQVIVFGSTGAIGRHLISILASEQPTWKIFAVTRGSPEGTNIFDGFPNVTVVQGDPNQREQVLQLSSDKDIIYSCIGFSRYETKYWAKHWPPIVDNLLEATSCDAAAAASDEEKGGSKKLVFCDNLYAYGSTTDISPKTPTVTPSRKNKPAIRAMIRRKLQQRMNEKPDSITVVGGSDFFGPLVTNVSFLGDTFTKAIVNDGGKKTAQGPICIGSASVLHDFAYVPDFSRALYIASIDDKANGKFWICPHTIRNKTMNQIATDIGCLSNSKNTKVTVYPGWSVKLLSPFLGFMWEMIEMLPFWSKDYTVDDSDFCTTFHVEATPYEVALKEYIEFYENI